MPEYIVLYAILFLCGCIGAAYSISMYLIKKKAQKPKLD